MDARRGFRLFGAVLGIGLGVGAVAPPAQAMPFVYKRFLNMFDKDHARLAPDFNGFKETDKPRLQGYLGRLKNHLTKIPANFHSDADYVARTATLAGLTAKLEGGAAPAPAATTAATPKPAKPAAKAKSDLDMARLFQSKYQALSAELNAAPKAVFGDAAKVTGYRARLAELKTIVDGYKDKTKKWATQTTASYQSYSTWFESAVAKAGGSAPPAIAVADRSGEPLDFQAKRAVGFFDKDLNRYAPAFTSGEDAAKLQGYLERLENRLSKVPPGFHAHAEVAARRAKIKELRASAASSADANQQKSAAAQAAASSAASAAAAAAATELDFTGKRDLRNYKRQFARYKNDFKEPFSESAEKLLGWYSNVRGSFDKINPKYHQHPEIAPLKKFLEELKPKIAAYGKQLEVMGAQIDTQLGLLKALFPFQGFDPELEGAPSPDQVRKWAERLKSWTKSYEDGKAFLERASRLPKLKKDQDFKVYRTWFPRVKFLIDAAEDENRRKWTRQSGGALNNLGINVEAISEANARASAARFQSALGDLDRLLAFQQAYDGKADPELEGKRGDLEDTIARLLGSANTRVERARMDTPTTAQKPELLERARKVLTNPRYELGETRAMKVTSLIESEKRVEYFDGTWYTKDWDEFQVTFAHKDAKKGGKWFISYANIKFYRKAWRTTRQNEWILGDFWGSREILEKNIQ